MGPGHTRICNIRVQQVPNFVNEILPLYEHFGSTKDVLVVNFGLHHNSGTYEVTRRAVLGGVLVSLAWACAELGLVLSLWDGRYDFL